MTSCHPDFTTVVHEPHFPKKKGGLDVLPNHPLRMVVCKYACKSHCQTVDQENRSQQFWLIALALEYDDIIQIAKHHLCSWTLNHTKPQL